MTDKKSFMALAPGQTSGPRLEQSRQEMNLTQKNTKACFYNVFVQWNRTH
jgi:hypothetical protein